MNDPMHRFYIDKSLAPNLEVGDRLDLPTHIFHQIVNVLRLRKEEQIALFTGDGLEWIAELITTSHRGDSIVRLVDVTEPNVEMETEISMLMALTRPQRYELALAKCTELGASEFRPIITERVLKSEATISANRIQRWQRIVCEAAELSGRVRVPNIEEPSRLKDVIPDASNHGASVILLWEDATEPMFADLLYSLRDMPNRPRKVSLVLGPVGGFSESEAQEAIDLGATVASLGPRILRTETAAIAAMSLSAQILR